MNGPFEKLAAFWLIPVALGALVGLVIGGRYLYERYQEHRADLHRHQCVALAPFLQALCQTYGCYDEYQDYLSDWLDEHQPFLARLAAFCRRAQNHWIDPATKPITVLAHLSVDAGSLAAVSAKDRTAFLEILRAEATWGVLRGTIPPMGDLLSFFRTYENEWRERLKRHQQDLDRRVLERMASSKNPRKFVCQTI